MHPKPKKRLGQNFLIDQNIRRKIIASCALKAGDHVLEIGPGKAELPGLIASSVKSLCLVELDPCLCEALKDNLKSYKNVDIINQDILKFNLKAYFKGLDTKIKVIGNIPYYITTPIIERMFLYRDMIREIYLSVQKEFAQRVVAASGSKDYGSLSCFLQYYACPRILFTIKKTCFYPAPKVDSCFLRLEIRDEPLVALADERRLFKVIRTAFSQRRKILTNSLKQVVSVAKLERFFKRYHISHNIRPEDLGLQDFINLIKS